MTTVRLQSLEDLGLDKLPLPTEEWRLDRLLPQPAQTGRPFRFESLEACWQEDIRRARALRSQAKILEEYKCDCDPLKLATLLTEAAENRRVEKCAASAAYMRDRRLALLGSILRLVHDQPQTEMAFVSISHIG